MSLPFREVLTFLVPTLLLMADQREAPPRPSPILSLTADTPGFHSHSFVELLRSGAVWGPHS